MDSKIENLLDKYWAAETSLEEERELKALLKENDRQGDLEEIEGLFAHFEVEGEKELDASFDEELLGMIGEKSETKVISFSGYFRRYASVAAAAVILVISSVLFVKQQNSYQPEDTFDSPEAALAEIKRQLLTVSLYMNKGNQQIGELSNLSEADAGMHDLALMNQAGIGMQPLAKMNISRE